MKKQFAIILFISFFGHSVITSAQQTGGPDYDQNIVKLNLTALPLRSFDVQYERAVSRKTSFAVSLRVIPGGGIPLLNQFSATDSDVSDEISKIRLSNFAITPEYRFYFGKHDGPRGFYVAPFVRYSSFSLSLPEYVIEDSNGSQGRTMSMDGNLRGISGGVMVGSQWKLGKQMYLDWWILGGGYGSSSGELTGTAQLSQSEQNDLRDDLESLDFPFFNTDVEVNSNGVRVDFGGPWMTLRGGLALGIRF